MKYLLFFLCFLSILSAKAIQFEKLPEGAEYRSEIKLRSDRVISQLKFLDQFFNSKSYSSIAMSGSSPVIDLNWLDRIYFHKKTNKQVLIKSGLEINFRLLKPGVVYKDVNGYLVHFKNADSNYAFMFLEHNQSEVAELLNSLNKTKQARNFQWPKFSLVSEAYAADTPSAPCIGDSGYTIPAPSAANDSTAKSFALEFLKTSAKSGLGCAKGLASGIWDATGGLVVSVAKGGYNLVTDTRNTLASLKNQVESVVGFFQNFSASMGNLWTGFLQLPTEAKFNVVCEVISALATSIAVPFAIANRAMLAGKIKAALTSAATLKAAGGSAGRATQIANQLQTGATASGTAQAAQIGEELSKLNQSIAKIETALTEAQQKKVAAQKALEQAQAQLAQQSQAANPIEKLPALSQVARRSVDEKVLDSIIEEMKRIQNMNVSQEQRTLAESIRKSAEESRKLFDQKIEAANARAVGSWGASSDIAEGLIEESMDIVEEGLARLAPRLDDLTRELSKNPPRVTVVSSAEQTNAALRLDAATREVQSIRRDFDAAVRAQEQASRNAEARLRDLGRMSYGPQAVQDAVRLRSPSALDTAAYNLAVGCQLSSSVSDKILNPGGSVK